MEGKRKKNGEVAASLFSEGILEPDGYSPERIFVIIISAN